MMRRSPDRAFIGARLPSLVPVTPAQHGTPSCLRALRVSLGIRRSHFLNPRGGASRHASLHGEPLVRDAAPWERRSVRVWATGVAVASVVLSACASTRPFVRPAGPASPLPDRAAVWQSATATCRAVRAYRGELRLSGKIDGQSVRSVTLPLVVDAEGRLGFGAQDLLGSTVFQFGGTTANATLYLRGDNRVIRGPAADIVEALIGVKLDPSRLLAVLAGCVATGTEATAAERFGSIAQVATGDATVFLVDQAGSWQPRAGTFDGLSVDYLRVEGGYPRQIKITSEPGRSPAADLTIAVRSLEINPVFTGAEFNPPVPPQALPASLDDLRAAGPLGERR